jgi:DNA polymerase-3 subunit epsilon
MGRWYLGQLEGAAERQAETAVFAAAEAENELTAKAGRREDERFAGAGVAGRFAAVVIYVNPELEKLRQLVAGARARLAELEVSYTKEKSRVDTVQAILFRRLAEHYQKRDQLRLIVDYRKKYLDSLIRGGDEEAKQAEENYERARTQADKDYEETAAAVAEKKQLTGEEEAELAKLWKKLVKLYHPDRFAHEPDKLETYEKLTAAINRAKDSGDIKTLRQIAEDPHGFIFRQGWASLDFSEEAELIQLRRLYETLQLEIVGVIESLGQLRESPEYELWQISDKKPGVLDELAAERAKVLEKERAELEKEAERLAGEIEELAGEAPARIG